MADNTKTFHSYSGVDMTAVFAGEPIGSIQAFSYSVNREKVAIYTMGKANPRAFARGKRMIAGSMIFILFDKNPVINHFNKAQFYGDKYENQHTINNRPGWTSELNNTGEAIGADLLEEQILMAPAYVDQIPPFEVVISAANEYGSRSRMKVLGVELMNENSGFSIDDIVVEQQYTYIAMDITPWEKVPTQQGGIDIEKLVTSKA